MRVIRILLIIIFITIPLENVFAYGIETHAALTQEIFNFYNQHFPQNKINEALKDYLIDGTRREDDGHRSFNHFYDPVYERGLNDILYGKGYASKIWAQDDKKQNETIYRIVGTVASILTAFQQRKLSDISTESNYTWQKAIEYYVRGEPEKAMFALGHIIHLIEDASVPAHTRNDGHPEFIGDGDPYEVWSHRFNRDNIHDSAEKNLKGKNPIIFDNLDSYFNSMAKYSNNNFYSGDTIGIQSGYDKPQVDPTNLIKDGIYFYAMANDNEFGNYHLLAYKNVPKKYTWAYGTEITLDDEGQDFILSDSWSRLSTKAIQHGAGIINLFFQEVDKAKAEGKYQEKQKSFLGQIIDSVTGFVSNIFSGGKPETVIPIKEQRENFESQLIDTKEMSKEASPPALVKKCQFITSQKPSHKDLIINEVAWMGSKENANAEWIELKNISGRNLDIAGYQIIDQSEQIQITISNSSLIPIGNFYLLERDKEEMVPGIRADLIYKGPLSNTDEGLRVFDANCNLIDEVFAGPSWPAGDNETKQTMERSRDLNWHTSVKVGGTPKQENSEPEKKEIIEEKGEEETNSINLIRPISSTSSTSSIGQISPISSAILKESVSFCSFATNKSPNHQKVIINEVAWMGTTNDPNDEWIELKNISTSDVDISGYQLLDKAEQIKIAFEKGTKISGNGFYLLERTDDTTVPGITADKIYNGVLANTNEGLRLFDTQCNLIDEILAESAWPAGDNSSKGTMERKNDLTWQTSQSSGGTPRAVNSSGGAVLNGGGGSNINQQQITSNNSTSTATSTSSSAANHIVISEFVYDAEGSDSGKEFVELYNPTVSDFNLKDWSLKLFSSNATSPTSLAFFGSNSADATIIKSKNFLLVGLNGNINGDIRRNVILPQSEGINYTIVLFDNTNQEIDRADYISLSAPGKSLERKAYLNSTCISAQGEGEFLGNGCDTDSSTDWEVRFSANPQNSRSLPEPRAAPAAVTDFILGYHFSVPTLIMSWNPSSDYTGSTSTLSYWIAEVGSSSPAPLNFNTTSTAADQRIYEIGRPYKISIRAVDADGLASTATIASVNVPSFVNSVYFYKDPRAGADKYLVEFNYYNYPFISDAYRESVFWKGVVFYLNTDASNEDELRTVRNWIPSDNSALLGVDYGQCAGGQAVRYSVILPDVADRCGVGGGLNNVSFDFTDIGQKNLLVKTASSTNDVIFTPADYITIGFYSFFDSGGDNQSLRLVAVDKTKYFFSR